MGFLCDPGAGCRDTGAREKGDEGGGEAQAGQGVKRQGGDLEQLEEEVLLDAAEERQVGTPSEGSLEPVLDRVLS